MAAAAAAAAFVRVSFASVRLPIQDTNANRIVEYTPMSSSSLFPAVNFAIVSYCHSAISSERYT